MPRAKKICAQPGCAAITTGSYCTTHTRERDKARGTSTQRGYGTDHIKARARIKPIVDAGNMNCARCDELIQPGEEWHLDHTDDNRSKYNGPAHARCNLSAAGKRSHIND